MAVCVCVHPSSVSATMKRRLEASPASPQEAKRAHDDSSSDEESQLSRQGRCFESRIVSDRVKERKICRRLL